MQIFVLIIMSIIYYFRALIFRKMIKRKINLDHGHRGCKFQSGPSLGHY